MTNESQLSEALALVQELLGKLRPVPGTKDLRQRANAFLASAQERPADESERECVADAVMRAAERLAIPLDPSRVGLGMATTNQADIDCAQLVLAYLRGRQSAPCPHLRSSDEGTQYCALAQSGAQGEPFCFIYVDDIRALQKEGRAFVYQQKQKFVFLSDPGFRLLYISPPSQPDDVRDALLKQVREACQYAYTICRKLDHGEEIGRNALHSVTQMCGKAVGTIDAALRQSAERGEKQE